MKKKMSSQTTLLTLENMIMVLYIRKRSLYSLRRNCLPNAEHLAKPEAKFVKIIQSTWHIR